MKELEEIYGIKIDNPAFFEIALTHPSYTQEQELPYTENYERMEFLGDAVLKLITSHILFKKYPEYTEGNLSKIRSIVVSDNTLAKIANEIGLCEHIILAKHEEKQGLAKVESVCACAFEAVLGAFYLDGKQNELIPFLEKVLTPFIEEVDGNFEKFNAKAILQEYTQGIDKKTPFYRLVGETGPDHKKVFTVEVLYQGRIIATGEGKSKKDAEQHSAYLACKVLGVIK
ncbi:ribonuclease III [bacterium]|nr:ribonuclease III [bacterium]